MARRSVPCAQDGNLGSIQTLPRPSRLSPFCPGIPKASPYPLSSQLALKLTHGCNDLEHEPSGRGAEIEIASEAHEGHAYRLQVSQCIPR